MYKLLQKTREVAKLEGFERFWVINEVISVRKDASQSKLEIFTEADLEKLS